ncbi:hypothetical protein AVEN_2671-1 [Araneus ventricosus]|uniref:Uncharacterized protein n=1 Tax=Araneus ventricosus TaxID=182803 RepID=A0A4Y2PRJ4_ARAVE|nr:hypothetical protein AVEN_2671-1 [Araneus ventricosus]
MFEVSDACTSICFLLRVISSTASLGFDRKTGFKKAIVYFDSWSLLQVLSNTAQDHPFTRGIQRRNANFGRKGYDILFYRIPAHVGILGNETADAAAKSATEFHTHPLPYADIHH